MSEIVCCITMFYINHQCYMQFAQHLYICIYHVILQMLYTICYTFNNINSVSAGVHFLQSCHDFLQNMLSCNENSDHYLQQQ